jgi:hypothetical protein
MEGNKFNFGTYRHTKENAMLIKQRRQRILEMRDSGLSFEEISKTFGLSKARCRKIYSTACLYKRPKSLNISHYVRGVLREHVPLLILKDGPCVRMNYPLLFMILGSNKDYFSQKTAKQYVRMIVHSARQELLSAYNALLLKFGHKELAKKWIRSEGAKVPSCFWNDKEIESFLLSCSAIKNPSQETVGVVLKRVKEILDASPSFVLSASEPTPEFETQKEHVVPDELFKKSDELSSYLELAKSDGSLKREDYVFLVESALECIKRFKDFCSLPSDETIDDPVQDEPAKVKEPVKEKPKAFWPKPKF